MTSRNERRCPSCGKRLATSAECCYACGYPPVNLAPASFLEGIAKIAPGVYGIPCAAELKTGRKLTCCKVLMVDWYTDNGNWINPNRIATISECPLRLPLPFAQILFEAGESGMDFCNYVVELGDGNSFTHVAGMGEIDFINLPTGYTPEDVVGVIPHAGRDRGSYRYVKPIYTVYYATEEVRPRRSRLP